MKTQTWKEYLYFSRKERIALIVLFSITTIFWLLPRMVEPNVLPPQLEKIVLKTTADSLVLTAALPEQIPAGAAPTLFFFNPNTLDEAGWCKLGLSEKVARTISHYREKGGHFYKPDDLRKIYGLQQADANRLVPYVRLSGNASPVVAVAATLPEHQAVAPVYYSGKHPVPTDINTASAEDWMRFPGIGEVLGNRIVAFRTKAGGFCSIMQVAQTYGVKDSVFMQMKPFLLVNNTTVPKLNINTATAFQLQTRPHITAEIAQAIIDYRQANGQYPSLPTLKVITGDVVYQQISHYLIAE